ncbi:DUF5996 family protein [Streptomyces sp. TS71-3]|uniref:DUF5996 family protein n=1 Tax=Streptomyces sp. TS71-3 TaxID=2733862 RepID=UPI001B03CA07|nr:DUF5996 family protein [Streptomyces sp. TS71-3]GHJ37456.1 hypothetical protein Sm713_30650 [Streptomyces sp. TS71-3]
MPGTPQPPSHTVEDWPSVPLEEWADTRDTLHLWTQIVGKVRLAEAPMVNHWWQVPLYVSPRGLTTSAIPYGERTFEMEFDFCDHRLHVRSSDGGERQVALEPKPVAAFYRETMAALGALGIEPRLRAGPVEVETAVPFPEDTEHASYQPEYAHGFWEQLTSVQRVFTQFRSRFIGKVSPVHFFWGSMDLTVSRFSGRPAPRHPGGAPHLADWVMVEAYSHEVSSCGFWPGGSAEGSFYSYVYPEPAGFARHPVAPAAASYSADAGEFLLPYEAVRTADDPDRTLLDFLQSSYEAAADHARWDRAALEDSPVRRASPR